MSIESNLEGLPGRGDFYSDEAAAAAPKARSTFEDDTLWERTAEAPWKLELLTIFLRNQLRIAPAMPLLTFMLAFTSLMWVPAFTAMFWLAATIASQAVQIYLCANFFQKERSESQQR